MTTLVGRHAHQSENIGRALDLALSDGYEFVLTHLSHPRYPQSFVPFSDIFIKAPDRCKVLAQVPMRNYTLKCNVDLLEKELSYAGHIGLTVVVIDCPLERASIKAMADVINRRLCPLDTTSGHHVTSVAIKVPLLTMQVAMNHHLDVPKIIDLDETWSRWNLVRILCQNNARVTVALTITSDLPDDERLARWLGEPIALVITPISIFLTNTKQFPVLSRLHQKFLQQVLRSTGRRCSFVVQGVKQHASLGNYCQYLVHLRDMTAKDNPLSNFEDSLQVPLQPLKDNLDSMIYEVFEDDHIKYEQYQLAITKAFASKSNTCLVVMVVGAGRGPLVDKALLAARKTCKQVTIYAVEKNPNAILTLEAINRVRWSRMPDGIVEIVSADMRTWEAPEKADVVISELLGSFSDNELSPECLDGIWRYVKEDTISIPCAYSSYIQPVQSQRLWSQIIYQSPATCPAPYDWGYVVQVTNAYGIAEPAKVFSFEHRALTMSSPPETKDNSRHISLEFRSKVQALCHGFVGYFDCQLYEDVMLSIVPATKNTEMNSWFPIFFPVETPFMVAAGATISLDISRLVEKHQRVWYEWTVMEPMVSKIHNANGRTYSISLMT